MKKSHIFPVVCLVMLIITGPWLSQSEVGASNEITIYLPLVLKIPSRGMVGVVTEKGMPVPMEQVILHYYINFTTYIEYSAETDANGFYAFWDVPELYDGQSYFVRWENSDGNEERLGLWVCNSVVYGAPDEIRTCNFDISGIQMTSPADLATITLPFTFTWTPRGFEDESYEFDLGFGWPDYRTYPHLGNVDRYLLLFRPLGFEVGVPYGWDIEVYTEDGYGVSFSPREVTFSQSSPGPRLAGRVTNNGEGVSDMNLTIQFWDGGTWSTYDTVETDLYGDYSFDNLPLLNNYSKVQVRWENPTENPDQLREWWCEEAGSSSSSHNYICDFDVKNITLLSPAGSSSVHLPVTFTWVSRGFNNESYEFSLFDPNNPDLNFSVYLPGNTNSYQLNSLPDGFSNGVQYNWNVSVYREGNGWGVSNSSRKITFIKGN